jgi:hypothetical protein
MLATPSRSNFSPYELWTKNKPPVYCTRIFGCKAYTAVKKNNRSWKLGRAGKPGVLIGFENEGTVYRIIRLSDYKLIRTRHAIFDEKVFPSLGVNSSDTFVVDPKDIFVEEVVLRAPSPSVDEPTCSSQPNDSPQPNVPRISVVGPRHPTLISSNILETNVLPFCRCPARALVTAASSIPTHYNQALLSVEAKGWAGAIKTELKAMERLAVWEVVDRTPNLKTVGTTWVFKKKDDRNANIIFKARLCAQGFSQTHGVDFSKTFAPTGRLNSLQALISHAAATGLAFQQLDVKTAFLNADLKEEVYLSIPQGVNEDKKSKCLKLKKAIYGLKQAPLAWHNRLSTWLLSVGFISSIADPCVFFRLDKCPVWLFIHVDDIAVFGKDLNVFKDKIKHKFDMKDLGQANLLLGIKVIHDPLAIMLSQEHYIGSLLDLYGMTNCRSVATPLVPGSHLDKATIEEIDCFNSLGVHFCSAVGALSYLSSATRPDISFAVSSLLQFLEAPGINHWEAFTHVLRYLAGTQHDSLIYHRDVVAPLEGYTDANWGNCLTSRRSVTGFLTLFNEHLIGWKTKKQPVVLISSCKAEYCALTDFSCELLWICQLVTEIGLCKINTRTVVHKDNQSFIAVANFEANTNSRRIKHVEIQLHFIREVINKKRIIVVYTPTNKMLADFLTKAVPRPALVTLLQNVGLFRLDKREGVEV